MSIPAEVRGRFYALRALAVALCALAAVAFVLRPNSYGFLLLGLAAIAIGMSVVRRSNAMVSRTRGQGVSGWLLAERLKRPGSLWWVLTGMSLVACVIFYLATYVDQLYGGKQAWPAYAFFASGLALTVTSGYVAMRIFQ